MARPAPVWLPAPTTPGRWWSSPPPAAARLRNAKPRWGAAAPALGWLAAARLGRAALQASSASRWPNLGSPGGSPARGQLATAPRREPTPACFAAGGSHRPGSTLGESRYADPDPSPGEPLDTPGKRPGRPESRNPPDGRAVRS